MSLAFTKSFCYFNGHARTGLVRFGSFRLLMHKVFVINRLQSVLDESFAYFAGTESIYSSKLRWC